MKRREMWQAKNHSHSSCLALFAAGFEKVLPNGCFGKTMIVSLMMRKCAALEASRKSSFLWTRLVVDDVKIEFHPGPHPPASQTKDVHVTAFVLKAFYPPELSDFHKFTRLFVPGRG